MSVQVNAITLWVLRCKKTHERFSGHPHERQTVARSKQQILVASPASRWEHAHHPHHPRKLLATVAFEADTVESRTHQTAYRSDAACWSVGILSQVRDRGPTFYRLACGRIDVH